MPMLPQNRTIVGDLEQGLSSLGLGRFDLIIHFGVLYHLQDWKSSLVDCVGMTNYLALETEVCDSDDPSFELKLDEAGYDQAISGVGSRPSAELVEAELRACRMALTRLDDNRCNANIHVYDWPVKNTGRWVSGQRRMWFCGREAVRP